MSERCRMTMKRRVHVFYSGRVQGVGFRMTAEETAQHFHILGWVKNLRDGRVEVLAEADEAALEQFLDAMRQGPMRNFITRVDASWGQAYDMFDEFEIRY